jgi:cytochrome c2
MYATDFFGAQRSGEAAGAGRVLRIAASTRTRDLPVDLRPEKWSSWPAKDRGKYLFVQVAGCGGCHRVERISAGREGPELTGLVPRLDARLRSDAYRTEVGALLAEPGAEAAALREVLAARGDGRLRVWLRHHLRNPRFDHPKGKMPSFASLGEEELEALVAFLLSLE